MARFVALVLAITLVLFGVWFKFVSEGGLGEHEAPGIVTAEVRPAHVIKERSQTLAAAADEMLVSKSKQILFGGPQCERDSAGDCRKVTLCDDASGKDDCLADHEPRAWSSPIFVDWKAGG